MIVVLNKNLILELSKYLPQSSFKITCIAHFLSHIHQFVLAFILLYFPLHFPRSFHSPRIYFPPHGCSSQALRHCLIQGGAFLQPSANPGAALLQPPPASHSHWLALSWAPGPQPGLEGPVGGDYDADHFVMCSLPHTDSKHHGMAPKHTTPLGIQAQI